MSVLATLVDVDALWQTIWTAAVAGVGVVIVFSLAVLGVGRSMDASRTGRGASAALFAIVALLGAAGTVGAIAYGIVLITSK